MSYQEYGDYNVSVALRDLSKRLSDIIDAYPDKSWELHDRMGSILLTAVKSEIPVEEGPRFRRRPGTVRKFQRKTVGDGGGYVAIRPYRSEKDGGVLFGNAKSQDNITVYLNNGHGIRRPSGRDPHYRSRVKHVAVGGYHFYESVREDTEFLCMPIVSEFVEELAKELNKPL